LLPELIRRIARRLELDFAGDQLLDPSALARRGIGQNLAVVCHFHADRVGFQHQLMFFVQSENQFGKRVPQATFGVEVGHCVVDRAGDGNIATFIQTDFVFAGQRRADRVRLGPPCQIIVLIGLRRWVMLK